MSAWLVVQMLGIKITLFSVTMAKSVLHILYKPDPFCISIYQHGAS